MTVFNIEKGSAKMWVAGRCKPASCLPFDVGCGIIGANLPIGDIVFQAYPIRLKAWLKRRTQLNAT